MALSLLHVSVAKVSPSCQFRSLKSGIVTFVPKLSELRSRWGQTTAPPQVIWARQVGHSCSWIVTLPRFDTLCTAGSNEWGGLEFQVAKCLCSSQSDILIKMRVTALQIYIFIQHGSLPSLLSGKFFKPQPNLEIDSIPPIKRGPSIKNGLFPSQ